jgi:hypothetical protein
LTDSTLAAPGSSHVADGSADVANGNTNVANGTTDVADSYNHIEGVMSIRSFFSDKRDGIHYLSVRGALSHLIGLSPNSGDEQWETEAQCESEIEARNPDMIIMIMCMANVRHVQTQQNSQPTWFILRAIINHSVNVILMNLLVNMHRQQVITASVNVILMNLLVNMHRQQVITASK